MEVEQQMRRLLKMYLQGTLLRTDIPKIEVNKMAITSSDLKSTSLVNDIQLRMMRSLVRKFITKKGLSLDQAQNLSMESFEGNKSLKELSERFFKVLNQINELKC